MPTPTSGTMQRRARVAALARHRPDDDPALIEARRDLAAERLARYVERALAEAPPPTPEQVDRVVALLAPYAQREAGAA